VTSERASGGGRPWFLSPLAGAAGFGALAVALFAAATAEVVGKTGAFFGAGSSLLVACLCLIAFNVHRPARHLICGPGWWSISRLGLRNASDRPGRTVLAIAVIAAATFILISVDAFRRVGPAATDRHSGVGGDPLQVDLLLPLAPDPNGPEGREALGLPDEKAVTVDPFRLLPGDDASCLNLYEPRNPRILGAGRAFIASGRFAFLSSLASSDAERQNPWLLLNQKINGQDGAVVPVIADANSITYVLHKKLGDDIIINSGNAPVTLRLVAALA